MEFQVVWNVLTEIYDDKTLAHSFISLKMPSRLVCVATAMEIFQPNNIVYITFITRIFLYHGCATKNLVYLVKIFCRYLCVCTCDTRHTIACVPVKIIAWIRYMYLSWAEQWNIHVLEPLYIYNFYIYFPSTRLLLALV